MLPDLLALLLKIQLKIMSDLIYLKGSPKELKPIIMQIMGIYQLLESKDVGTIYASISERETVRRKGKPKVTLYFLEDTDFKQTGINPKTPQGRRRIEGVIRFRLMNETTQTFSKANGTILGAKIKEVFGANNGFVWSKGKSLYTYNDWERGYQFQLLCRSKNEAKRIIAATHSLQNHTPDWTNLFENENDQEATVYSENPGNQIIMGETMPIPRSRPNVEVRFQYAYVKLANVKEPIALYDRKHRLKNPLVF